MTLAMERIVAPAVGTPARSFSGEIDPRLEISVVFTTVDATLDALKEAGSLARMLDGRITLIVPQTVPYPLPLESPPMLVDFNERRLRVLTAGCKVDTRIAIYLCRDTVETLQSVLKPGSLVVVGARKRWWPTREKRLASKLRKLGHEVVVTERK